jgi:hypothetical protein
VSKGKALCGFVLLLAVGIPGCGYNGEQALDSHQKGEVTETKFDVVTGSVYTQGDKAIFLNFNDQKVYTLTPSQRNKFNVMSDYPAALHQPGFLDDNNDFFFHGATTNAILSATFANETLYSFFEGIPIPKASVTLTQEWNWNGDSGLTLHVGKKLPFSTISINPYSNLAYWLKTVDPANYATYGAARDKVNELLGLPPGCRFEEDLCPSHLKKLRDGVQIHADATSYTIIRPREPACVGPITQFSDCPL